MTHNQVVAGSSHLEAGNSFTPTKDPNVVTLVGSHLGSKYDREFGTAESKNYVNMITATDADNASGYDLGSTVLHEATEAAIAGQMALRWKSDGKANGWRYGIAHRRASPIYSSITKTDDYYRDYTDKGVYVQFFTLTVWNRNTKTMNKVGSYGVKLPIPKSP